MGEVKKRREGRRVAGNEEKWGKVKEKEGTEGRAKEGSWKETKVK